MCLLAVVSLSLVCVGSSGAGSAAKGLEPGTITIGYDGSLTGIYASYDEPVRNAVKLAMAQINAKGGIGGKVKINIIVKDNKTELPTTVTVAQELADQGVDVLFGNDDSGQSIAISSVAQKNNITALIPFHADPSVFSNYPVAWGTGQAGNAQVAAALDYLKSIGVKTAYLVDAPDIAYMAAFTKYFKAGAPSRGIKVVGTGNFNANMTDFSPLVTSIKSANPDVVWTAMYAPSVGTFLKQLRASGVKSKFMGTDAMDNPLFVSVAGKDVNGALDVVHGFASPGSGVAKLYAQYQKRYGKAPQGTTFVLEGYDAVKTLEAAVLKAQSTDTLKIREALESGVTVHGAQGDFKILPGHHYAFKKVAIVTYKNGKQTLIKFAVPKNVPPV